MTKDDLKQIGDLMDGKLEKALQLNNEQLLVKFDEKLEKAISDIASAMNIAFTEHEEKTNQRFDKIDAELANKPSLHQINAWADNNLIPFQRDVEKLKFLSIKKFKNLPDNLTISSALIEEGL